MVRAGKWSLDHAIGWDVSGLWWGIGAAVVALIGAVLVMAVTRRMSNAAGAPAGPGGPIAGAR